MKSQIRELLNQEISLRQVVSRYDSFIETLRLERNDLLHEIKDLERSRHILEANSIVNDKARQAIDRQKVAPEKVHPKKSPTETLDLLLSKMTSREILELMEKVKEEMKAL